MSAAPDRLDAAEALLAHRFADRSLLDAALTHPSATDVPGGDWQRLEFLGDAVLDLVVADVLYRANPDLAEGELTKRRAALVSAAALAEAGRRLGLDELIVLGASEIAEGERGMPSAIEACMEAVVGALYLDGGVDAAGRFVHMAVISQADSLPTSAEHPRSALQELLQSRGKAPEYRTVAERGPAHEPVFTVEVAVDGEVLGSGTGSSKKEAVMRAAEAALDRLSAGR